MRRTLALLILLVSLSAQAHVGSPDVYYDGMVGPYPTHVTIRVPNVVPGRAEIIARVQTGEHVEVSFLPLYSKTAVSNAPPPDVSRLIPGETNLYSGELWLMSVGAYSVEVRVKGPKGDGKAQIPVTSVALHQLPMPGLLGKLLVLLCAILVVGGIGIAAAGFREADLAPGARPGKSSRRKGITAAVITASIFALALIGGKYWWAAEENTFRGNLLEGAGPDLSVNVQQVGSQRVLQLEVGPQFFKNNHKVSLIPDHGKLMHLFLVRAGTHDAFAHLHPVRKSDYNFEVIVPPLPAGRYSIFCDVTFESGLSSTATNSVLLPAAMLATTGSTKLKLQPDPDDSWSGSDSPAQPSTTASKDDPICKLPEGIQVTWQSHTPVRTRRDAGLRFAATDAAGDPLALEPYMGMLCHAAVLRKDESVFAHLHPSGNFSMAAQLYFESKLTREGMATPPQDLPATTGEPHSQHHGSVSNGVSSVYLPYEFPAPGDYRIWVQLKIAGRVHTASFDTHVAQ